MDDQEYSTGGFYEFEVILLERESTLKLVLVTQRRTLRRCLCGTVVWCF